jgi:hypothetical protein
LRFDSHDDLPEELKNVAVQRFISKSEEPSFIGKLMGYRRERTGDEILERLSKEKEVLNERFRQLLREVGTQKKTAAYEFGEKQAVVPLLAPLAPYVVPALAAAGTGLLFGAASNYGSRAADAVLPPPPPPTPIINYNIAPENMNPWAAGAIGAAAIGTPLAAYYAYRRWADSKKKQGPAVNKTAASSPAWQRSAGKNEEGGLNAKGRASYNKATGGNLKAPVTESNPTGERESRQNSFCSRMCGMKRVNTGAKTKSDPDSRINKSLRKWNCKCAGVNPELAAFGEKQASPMLENLLNNKLLLGSLKGGLMGGAAGAISAEKGKLLRGALRGATFGVPVGLLSAAGGKALKGFSETELAYGGKPVGALPGYQQVMHGAAEPTGALFGALAGMPLGAHLLAKTDKEFEKADQRENDTKKKDEKEAGFRWYKRFPMTENLAVNLSLGGPSLTVKKLIPGTSFTLGKRAPRMYIGTPIPGLAYQQYLSPKKHKVKAEKEFKDDPDDQRTVFEKIKDTLFGSDYGPDAD